MAMVNIETVSDIETLAGKIDSKLLEYLVNKTEPIHQAMKIEHNRRCFHGFLTNQQEIYPEDLSIPQMIDEVVKLSRKTPGEMESQLPELIDKFNNGHSIGYLHSNIGPADYTKKKCGFANGLMISSLKKDFPDREFRLEKAIARDENNPHEVLVIHQGRYAICVSYSDQQYPEEGFNHPLNITLITLDDDKINNENSKEIVNALKKQYHGQDWKLFLITKGDTKYST